MRLLWGHHVFMNRHFLRSRSKSHGFVTDASFPYLATAGLKQFGLVRRDMDYEESIEGLTSSILRCLWIGHGVQPFSRSPLRRSSITVRTEVERRDATLKPADSGERNVNLYIIEGLIRGGNRGACQRQSQRFIGSEECLSNRAAPHSIVRSTVL